MPQISTFVLYRSAGTGLNTPKPKATFRPPKPRKASDGHIWLKVSPQVVQDAPRGVLEDLRSFSRAPRYLFISPLRPGSRSRDLFTPALRHIPARPITHRPGSDVRNRTGVQYCLSALGRKH